MLAIKLKQQGGFCDNAAIASSTSAEALCGMCTCLPCQHGGCIQNWIRWVSWLLFFCFPEQSPLRSAKTRNETKQVSKQINSPLFSPSHVWHWAEQGSRTPTGSPAESIWLTGQWPWAIQSLTLTPTQMYLYGQISQCIKLTQWASTQKIT